MLRHITKYWNQVLSNDQSCEDAAFPMQAAEKIHKLFATKHSMNYAVRFMLTLNDRKTQFLEMFKHVLNFKASVWPTPSLGTAWHSLAMTCCQGLWKCQWCKRVKFPSRWFGQIIWRQAVPRVTEGHSEHWWIYDTSLKHLYHCCFWHVKTCDSNIPFTENLWFNRCIHTPIWRGRRGGVASQPESWWFLPWLQNFWVQNWGPNGTWTALGWKARSQRVVQQNLTENLLFQIRSKSQPAISCNVFFLWLAQRDGIWWFWGSLGIARSVQGELGGNAATVVIAEPLKILDVSIYPCVTMIYPTDDLSIVSHLGQWSRHLGTGHDPWTGAELSSKNPLIMKHPVCEPENVRRNGQWHHNISTKDSIFTIATEILSHPNRIR